MKGKEIQSNPVNFFSEETTESVRIKRVMLLKCVGVFEELARHTMRYQESDLHLAFILLNLLTTSAYTTSTLLFLLFSIN